MGGGELDFAFFVCVLDFALDFLARNSILFLRVYVHLCPALLCAVRD